MGRIVQMMKPKLSLNQKLVLLIVSAYVVIVALLVVGEYRSSKKESMAFLRERIVQLSGVVQYGTMALMLQNKCECIEGFLRKSAETIRAEVTIFEPYTGAILLSSRRANGNRGMIDDDFSRYLTYTDQQPMSVVKNGEQHMIRFLPLENAKSCQPCHPSESSRLGVIKIEQNLTKSLRDTKANMINRIMLSTIAITLFALFFSYVVMKLISEPLGRIIKTLRHIEGGDLDSRVAIERDDIIGELGKKINSMTQKRKEASIELQKCHDQQVMKASQMASIGEMAACIAHDIKNPLACMSGALQVIDHEMGEGDENKPIIREVIEQIDRIDGSVKKILHYAKPEAERVSVVDLDEVLDQTLTLTNQYAGRRNVSVSFAKGAGSKRVRGGSEALQRLFFNVCLNGIEAMEGGGSLAIVSSLRDDVIANRDGRWAEIEIRDTGCGIDDRDLGLIFKPLFTTKTTGTGLGLSISAEIVERYSGFIDVKSVLGRGTHFKIYFPVTAEG